MRGNPDKAHQADYSYKLTWFAVNFQIFARITRIYMSNLSAFKKRDNRCKLLTDLNN